MSLVRENITTVASMAPIMVRILQAQEYKTRAGIPKEETEVTSQVRSRSPKNTLLQRLSTQQTL